MSHIIYIFIIYITRWFRLFILSYLYDVVGDGVVEAEPVLKTRAATAGNGDPQHQIGVAFHLAQLLDALGTRVGDGDLMAFAGGRSIGHA